MSYANGSVLLTIALTFIEYDIAGVFNNYAPTPVIVISQVPSLIPTSEVITLTAPSNGTVTLTEARAYPTSNGLPVSTSTGTLTSSGTSTTSVTASPSGISPPSGPSIGVAVGAAIGALVIGLMLGLLLGCVWKRHRHDRKKHQNIQYHPPDQGNDEAAIKQYEVPHDDGKLKQHQNSQLPLTHSIQLDRFLLDTSPDKEISAELQSLAQLIQQHVENNYHLQPVQVNPAALVQAIVNLGIAHGPSLAPDAIAALAVDTRSRQTALRHIISKVVFTSIDFNSRSRLSMLPAPIAAFLQSIPSIEPGSGNKEAATLALSKWRTLSAFLLHPTRSQRTSLVPADSAIAPQASGLVNALNTFLGPFVGTDDASKFQQRTHLQAVIIECTRFGYVLFSQPSEWRFVHGGGASQSRTVVVCAGLDKVSSRDGTPYDAAHHVVAPLEVHL